MKNEWIGLWCLTTIFQLYRGSQFYLCKKLKYPEKTTNLPQVTDNSLSHNVVSSTPRLNRIQKHNISGDRHIGSCKSTTRSLPRRPPKNEDICSISNNNNHYSCTEICTIYYNLITK